MHIPHKSYDRVIDNDWTANPHVTLFRGQSSTKEILDFAVWCGQFTGKLRVTFHDHFVSFTKAVS